MDPTEEDTTTESSILPNVVQLIPKAMKASIKSRNKSFNGFSPTRRISFSSDILTSVDVVSNFFRTDHDDMHKSCSGIKSLHEDDEASNLLYNLDLAMSQRAIESFSAPFSISSSFINVLLSGKPDESSPAINLSKSIQFSESFSGLNSAKGKGNFYPEQSFHESGKNSFQGESTVGSFSRSSKRPSSKSFSAINSESYIQAAANRVREILGDASVRANFIIDTGLEKRFPSHTRLAPSSEPARPKTSDELDANGHAKGYGFRNKRVSTRKKSRRS
jgi:hypothetical protein